MNLLLWYLVFDLSFWWKLCSWIWLHSLLVREHILLKISSPGPPLLRTSTGKTSPFLLLRRHPPFRHPQYTHFALLHSQRYSRMDQLYIVEAALESPLITCNLFIRSGFRQIPECHCISWSGVQATWNCVWHMIICTVAKALSSVSKCGVISDGP